LGRSFGKLWAAVGISNLGDGVTAVAFPLLVAAITRDPVLVAGATVAGRLPWLVFALPAGAVADRLDRRRVMVLTDAFRAILVALLGVLLFAGGVSLPAVYVVAFLLGSAETLYDTSSEAIVPALVGEDLLPAANGRLQATEWVGNAFLGPPVGAVLLAAAAGLPFLVDGASFLAAALLVGWIAGRFRSTRLEPSTTLRADIGEGLRWLWRHTVLRTLAMMAGVTNLLATAILAIFVLYVQDVVGLGDVGFGLVMALAGAGGLVGALVTAVVVRRVGPGTTLPGVVVVEGVVAVTMGVVSSPWVVGTMAVLFGLSVTAWNVVAVSLRQSLTPDALRGRVASVARLLAWGTQPLGALVGGGIASWLGLRAPFLVAAAGLLLMLGLTASLVNDRRIAAARSAALG